MLNPTPLLSFLNFRVAGNSEVAGRATITAQAAPRPEDPRHARFVRERHDLGTGAHLYQCGAISTSLRSTVNAECYWPSPRSATDSPSTRSPHWRSASTSRSQPRPSGSCHRKAKKSTRSKVVATVCGPSPSPKRSSALHSPFSCQTAWPRTGGCTACSSKPLERPPMAAHVSLSYHSSDGHESVSISQSTAGDHQYRHIIDDEKWEVVDRDGTSVRIRPAEWPQAQAHVERDGTFVFLVSDNLTGDQLATIAAGLRPAPRTGSI